MTFNPRRLKSFVLICVALTLTSCGSSRKLTASASKGSSNVSSNPFDGSGGCSVPLNVAINQISPAAGVSITPNTDVVYQVTLSGGCLNPPQYLLRATPNPFVGGLETQTITSSPFTFSNRFTAGSNKTQSVTVQAFNADRSIYQTVTKTTAAFNVVEAAANTLECAGALTLAPGSAPIDVSGDFALPRPTRSFSVQFLKNGMQVNGKIISMQAVNPLLPVTLINPAILSASAAEVPAFNIAIGFNRPGLQQIDFAVASGTSTTVCRATVPITGIAGPAPSPASATLTAAPANITLGNTSSLTWTTQNAGDLCVLVNGSGTNIYTGGPSGSFVVTPQSVSDSYFALYCAGAKLAEVNLQITPRVSDVVWNYVPGSQASPNPLPMPMFDGWINYGPTYGNNPGGWDGYGELLCTGSPECDTWAILRANGMNTAGLRTVLDSRVGLTAACGGNQPTQNGAVVSWGGDPRAGKVGVYPFVHGGGALNLVLTTNLRTFSLSSTNVRGQATFSPGSIVDGSKILFIYRSYQRSTLYKIVTLNAGETAIALNATATLSDNANCGAAITHAER